MISETVCFVVQWRCQLALSICCFISFDHGICATRSLFLEFYFGSALYMHHCLISLYLSYSRYAGFTKFELHGWYDAEAAGSSYKWVWDLTWQQHQNVACCRNRLAAFCPNDQLEVKNCYCDLNLSFSSLLVVLYRLYNICQTPHGWVVLNLR